MALKNFDTKELWEREVRYAEVRDIKLDMLRRLHLRLITGRTSGAFFEDEVSKSEVAEVIGEKKVKAFNEYLQKYRSDESSRYGKVVEWVETLDIFTAWELEALKKDVSIYGTIQIKTISELISYIEWSETNNKELYPLRHFTYLVGVSPKIQISFIEFLDTINEDSILTKFTDHFAKDYREVTLLQELIKTLDAPDWYKEALADGFSIGALPEVAEAMVSYMEKTNQ